MRLRCQGYRRSAYATSVSSRDGAVTDKSLPEAERPLSDLFAGSIGSYKNPSSHRTVQIDDASEANEMLMLASVAAYCRCSSHNLTYTSPSMWAPGNRSPFASLDLSGAGCALRSALDANCSEICSVIRLKAPTSRRGPLGALPAARTSSVLSDRRAPPGPRARSPTAQSLRLCG
jgi:hypothetical protein